MNQNKAISLKNILSQNQYVIPIYQRNYSWGKGEISQLITDIKEYFSGDKTDEDKTDEDKTYYLGSLVYFKRDNGDLELIDGQQRHTTLTLINLVLMSNDYGQVKSTNLKFDSRKNIQNYIEKLYSNFSDFDKISSQGVKNIQAAINIIQEELSHIDIQKFSTNFYENVKVFLVEVPQDTDLNHYFEIMNNRGEQLEKHEIVKSLLMGKIDDNDNETKQVKQEKFAKIWDACSDMTDYVWSNFNSDEREIIFKEQENIIFDEINFKTNYSIDQEKTLSEILNDEKSIDLSSLSQEKKEIKAKYRSIIDFPNFLMQVLKLVDENTPLDDKKLLEYFQHKDEVFSLKFINYLLKYRIVFDKYVIKQDLTVSEEDRQNWGIRKYNETLDYNVKTFSENDDELIKLLTMLYYSNPSNSNNNWLHDILKFNDFSLNGYIEKLLSIAKDKYDGKKITYPEITIYNFYYIDFLLWKLYKEDELNKEDKLYSLKEKINRKKLWFKDFKFSQLNSKEHLLPQSKINENTEEANYLNNLGNLCLISVSQNSSANDQHPEYKKRHFANDNSSLKRLVMFESYDNENWGSTQIKAHEKEILQLLEKYNN